MTQKPLSEGTRVAVTIPAEQWRTVQDILERRNESPQQWLRSLISGAIAIQHTLYGEPTGDYPAVTLAQDIEQLSPTSPQHLWE
jgi:hypothetical protein